MNLDGLAIRNANRGDSRESIRKKKSPSYFQRAENGVLDGWSLNLRFWGAPIFSPEAPTLILKDFGAIWGKNLGRPKRRSNDHGSNAPFSALWYFHNIWAIRANCLKAAIRIFLVPRNGIRKEWVQNRSVREPWNNSRESSDSRESATRIGPSKVMDASCRNNEVWAGAKGPVDGHITVDKRPVKPSQTLLCTHSSSRDTDPEDAIHKKAQKGDASPIFGLPPSLKKREDWHRTILKKKGVPQKKRDENFSVFFESAPWFLQLDLEDEDNLLKSPWASNNSKTWDPVWLLSEIRSDFGLNFVRIFVPIFFWNSVWFFLLFWSEYCLNFVWIFDFPKFDRVLNSDMSEFCLNLSEFCLNFVWLFV